MNQSERLPPTISEKACPRCKELMYWSQHEAPPKVNFNIGTGYINSVELMLFCENCGYREVGSINIDRDPVWIPR